MKENLYSKLAINNDKKIVFLEEKLKETQLLLEAPSEYKHLKKMFHLDEEIIDKEEKLGPLQEDFNIRSNNKNQIIFNTEELISFLYENNYNILKLKDYKLKTPINIIKCINEFFKQNPFSTNNPDHFYILYPKYLKNPKDRQEIIKNRQSETCEEVVLIYLLEESRHTSSNYYVVLNSIGKSVKNNNFFKNLWHTFSNNTIYTNFKKDISNSLITDLEISLVINIVINVSITLALIGLYTSNLNIDNFVNILCITVFILSNLFTLGITYLKLFNTNNSNHTDYSDIFSERYENFIEISLNVKKQIFKIHAIRYLCIFFGFLLINSFILIGTDLSYKQQLKNKNQIIIGNYIFKRTGFLNYTFTPIKK